MKPIFSDRKLCSMNNLVMILASKRRAIKPNFAAERKEPGRSSYLGADPRELELLGVRSRLEPAQSFFVLDGLGLAVGRVVPDGEGRPVKAGGEAADRLPGRRRDVEVIGAFRQVDRRGRKRVRPSEGALSLQAGQDRLGQRDVAFERRVHPVVEQRI